VELRVDNLANPLGIDDPTPAFSWQLHDPVHGALQTAYELSVATTPALLASKPDVWSSGHFDSAQSLNIRYAGPALNPSTRYYWHVKVWGASGKEYAPAKPAWFETGLLAQDAWKADQKSEWVGYETPEESAVRHAPAQWIASPEAKSLAADKSLPEHFAYRSVITVDKPVKSAALYATGQDTVSAWLNGTQVLEAQQFPPWHQMPWKKFVRADVTAKLAAGSNTISLESVLYSAPQFGPAAAPPVIATLYVEFADGTTATFNTNPDWKTAIHALSGWEQKAFDDSSWKSAVEFKAPGGPMAAALGHPWIPDSVKALRHNFDVTKPIKSARLYSTALGTYELFLNG
jgi:alpha-L-rhamnosidase